MNFNAFLEAVVVFFLLRWDVALTSVNINMRFEFIWFSVEGSLSTSNATTFSFLYNRLATFRQIT